MLYIDALPPTLFTQAGQISARAGYAGGARVGPVRSSFYIALLSASCFSTLRSTSSRADPQGS